MWSSLRVAVCSVILAPALLVGFAFSASADGGVPLSSIGPQNAWVVADLAEDAAASTGSKQIPAEVLERMFNAPTVKEAPTKIVRPSAGWKSKAGLVLNSALVGLSAVGLIKGRVSAPSDYAPPVSDAVGVNAVGTSAWGMAWGLQLGPDYTVAGPPTRIWSMTFTYTRTGTVVAGTVNGFAHCSGSDPGQLSGRWVAAYGVTVAPSTPSGDANGNFGLATPDGCSAIDRVGLEAVASGESGLATETVAGRQVLQAGLQPPHLSAPLSDGGAPEQGTVTTTLECVKADGSSYTVTATGTPQEITALSEVVIPDAGCDAGDVLKSGKADVAYPGGRTDTILPRTENPPEVQELVGTQPGCLVPTGAPCTLDLQVARNPDAATDPEKDWRSCWADPGLCTDLHSITPAQQTRKYRCLIGTIGVVGLERCLHYFPRVSPPGVDLVVPGVEVTGEPPAPPPGSSYDCWPNGFTWNPLDWVLTPLKCAFIPAPGTFEAGWAKVDLDWCETAPGALSCAVGDVFGPFTHLGETADPADCLGVGITVPNLLNRAGDGIMHPLSACSDAAKAVQSFWLPFSTGAVYLGAILLGARMVSKTIGADDAVPS